MLPGLVLVGVVAVLAARPPAVRPGLEVLVTDSLGLVAGQRVGLVANQAAVDREGVHAVDRLLGAGVRLTALFAAEHGFRGTAAPGEPIDTEVDRATGLPIYSIYGRTREPTDSMLAGVDVILVDLPDVGARFFTFYSTTIAVMRAAARTGKRVVVLDRPNPIGGTMQGPMLDPAFRSFLGGLETPVRHGLTLGELARLARVELDLATDLVVVPAAHWRRDVDAFSTGLPFIPPSANLRDLEALFHYPGTCLFEATDLSVGRGTDRPFHQVGAPWLDTAAVLAVVRAARVPGVRWESVTFTPTAPGDGKHPDTLLRGIRLVMTDRHRYDPLRAAVTLLAGVRRVHPDRIGIDARRFDTLAGGASLRTALEAGEPVDDIVAGWAGPVAAYRERVAPLLLYR